MFSYLRALYGLIAPAFIKSPGGFSMFAAGLTYAIGPVYLAVVVGKNDGSDNEEKNLLQDLRELYLPHVLPIFGQKEGGAQGSKRGDLKRNLDIISLNPSFEAYFNGEPVRKPLCYICDDDRCYTPVESIGDALSIFLNLRRFS